MSKYPSQTAVKEAFKAFDHTRELRLEGAIGHITVQMWPGEEKELPYVIRWKSHHDFNGTHGCARYEKLGDMLRFLAALADEYEIH